MAKFGEIITTLAHFIALSFLFQFVQLLWLYIRNMKKSAIKWAKVMIISPNLARISKITLVFDCTKKISKNYCSYCFFYCYLLFLLIPLIPSCGSINQQLTSFLLVVLRSQYNKAIFRLVKPNKLKKSIFVPPSTFNRRLGTRLPHTRREIL